MAQYTAPKEINSESHIFLWLFAFDFFFILVYIMVSLMLKNLVATKFQVPFMIFSIICAITLTLPSPYNKKRRIYQTILIYCNRDGSVYHQITGKETDERSGS